MALNFPDSPANNAMWPINPTQPGVAYVAKTSPSKTWRDIRGRAENYNRIPNGGLTVSQLNGFTDGTNVASLWVADCWKIFYTSNAVSWRGQLVEAATPSGSNRRARITINTADTALTSGEWLALTTVIEGTFMADMLWGTANAKPIVVRFGFNGPAGTYGMSIRNGIATPNRSWVTSWTISAGQAYTDTLQTFVIPGCPSSTWNVNTTAWCWLNFTMANANTTASTNQWATGNFTSPTGITNGMGTVGRVYEFFDIGLYADPNFTGLAPEFEVPEYGAELRRMQRYIAKVFGLRGIVTSGSVVARAGTTLPAPMRVVPSLRLQGVPEVYDGQAASGLSGVGATYSNRNVVTADLSAISAVLIGGRSGTQYFSNDGAYIVADASL